VPAVAVALTYTLEDSAAELARKLGMSAAELPLEHACFQLSACYTAMLPQAVRSNWGAYYTPPALTDRLLGLATEAGIDWRTARTLDPACGGGAFLLPVALKMRGALGDLDADQLLGHFASHLQGFEIDPFAAWLTQAWLEIAFSAELRSTGRQFPRVVKVGDSLEQDVTGETFDLVVGNPPYGRVKLPPRLREKYRRSLYGHANLYGLFTDLALRWAKPDGVIAYVTPTSFFAGEYFKALRGLLAREARPLAVDFIDARKGVFEDVLQEAMLATYRKGATVPATAVHYLAMSTAGEARVSAAGSFAIPTPGTAPWLAPRHADQQPLIAKLARMPTRLADWGYKVSTGPLVWNRFKPQFRDRPIKSSRPVIWAESVTADGRFVFRAEKRGHQPHFKLEVGDDWLVVTEPCVLLQRTTAKEQPRRLIAAELPRSFIDLHDGVIVENHLNMVKPVGKPLVSAATIAAVLNSGIVDKAFRCISGSVAVSAFELEALPLPAANEMQRIEKLVAKGAEKEAIDDALLKLYEAQA
jgi:adenine-specific DNA-methyltransferase